MKRAMRHLLGITVLARAASAQPLVPTDVVIVGDPADPLVSRLEANLRESRLRARIAPRSSLPLQELAGAARARAVIRVSAAHHELEVWLASWQAGRPLLDVRIRNEPPSDDEALVLQCVELVREATVPVPSPPPRPTPTARAASPAPGAREPPRAGLRLELGGGYNAASRRLHWASLEGALGVTTARWFALGRVSAPLYGAVVSEREGSAQAQTASFGITTGAWWRTERVRLRVGPMLGTRSLRVTGTASNAPVRSQHTWQFEAGLDALVEWQGRLPLFLGMRGSVVAPRGDLRFLGTERDTFGPLVLAAQLGLAFDGTD